MGKSLTATMVGQLIHQGVYELDQPAPIPAWQAPGDPRAAIRIRDILNMSSGLRFRAMQDPDYDPAVGYPDHLYVYTGGIDAAAFAAGLSQQWQPGTVGRYRNCDPVLGNYLVRLATEGEGEEGAAAPAVWGARRLGCSCPIAIAKFASAAGSIGSSCWIATRSSGRRRAPALLHPAASKAEPSIL